MKTDSEDLQPFRDEGADGKVCLVRFVPVGAFDGMIEAANAGDKDAQQCALAFTEWTNQVRPQIAAGWEPACFCCEAVIQAVSEGGDGIGGIAVVMPTAKEHSESLVAVFCPRCETASREQLLQGLRNTIAENLGLRSFQLQ